MNVNPNNTPYKVFWIHRQHHGYGGWSVVGTTFVATREEAIALVEKKFGAGIESCTALKARDVLAFPISDKHPDGWGWGLSGGWDMVAERNRKQVIKITEEK